MKKETGNTPGKSNKEENAEDLKKQAADKDSVKKGYNEKNPAQPQGSFKPDGKKD